MEGVHGRVVAQDAAGWYCPARACPPRLTCRRPVGRLALAMGSDYQKVKVLEVSGGCVVLEITERHPDMDAVHGILS